MVSGTAVKRRPKIPLGVAHATKDTAPLQRDEEILRLLPGVEPLDLIRGKLRIHCRVKMYQLSVLRLRRGVPSSGRESRAARNLGEPPSSDRITLKPTDVARKPPSSVAANPQHSQKRLVPKETCLKCLVESTASLNQDHC